MVGFNGFNNYFANIPTELDKQIPKDDDDPTTYIRENNPNSFFLDPVTKLEVTDIYRNIKTNSAGYDNLSRNLINDVFSILAESLTHIINLSFQTGVVPEQIKTSVIKPK